MAKTGRAVIVHEAPRTAGFGAEVAALLAERGILDLRAPVRRVTGFDVPYPYWSLEDRYIPSVDRVVAALEEVLQLLSDPHLIRLPDLGEGLTGAEVVRWLVGERRLGLPGPAARRGRDRQGGCPDPLAGRRERSTGLLVAEGAQASVGDALAEIAAERRRQPRGPRALPRVRALASELGVDLAALRPTGPW